MLWSPVSCSWRYSFIGTWSCSFINTLQSCLCVTGQQRAVASETSACEVSNIYYLALYRKSVPDPHFFQTDITSSLVTISSMRPGTPKFSHHWLSNTKYKPGTQNLPRKDLLCIVAVRMQCTDWAVLCVQCLVQTRHLVYKCSFARPRQPCHLVLPPTNACFSCVSARLNIIFSGMHSNMKLMLKFNLNISMHYFYVMST